MVGVEREDSMVGDEKTTCPRKRLFQANGKSNTKKHTIIKLTLFFYVPVFNCRSVRGLEV